MGEDRADYLSDCAKTRQQDAEPSQLVVNCLPPDRIAINVLGHDHVGPACAHAVRHPEEKEEENTDERRDKTDNRPKDGSHI